MKLPESTPWWLRGLLCRAKGHRWVAKSDERLCLRCGKRQLRDGLFIDWRDSL